MLRKNLQLIQSKLTNNVTNKRKEEVCEEITKAVNYLGVAARTTVDVKEKWKCLHSKAKKELSEYRREQRKTGGGPAPKQPSVTSENIIDLLEDTPAFSGLQGFESGS